MDDGCYAGLRCPKCFWALYDGIYGMNPDCYCYGKRLRKRIRLTNTEAQKRIVELSNAVLQPNQ